MKMYSMEEKKRKKRTNQNFLWNISLQHSKPVVSSHSLHGTGIWVKLLECDVNCVRALRQQSYLLYKLFCRDGNYLRYQDSFLSPPLPKSPNYVQILQLPFWQACLRPSSTRLIWKYTRCRSRCLDWLFRITPD